MCGEVQVEVVNHVAIAVAVAGGAAVGWDHIGFLAVDDDAFIVPPHVATQSLASGKSLVTFVVFVNPTACDCSCGDELSLIAVARFVAAECLVRIEPYRGIYVFSDFSGGLTDGWTSSGGELRTITVTC
ncbi:Hypothetical predicted protein [Olea europaea subsp. europaea]|uniref:Uncharacterized protein n=1 Tax=Olea europaea subsp. europaea TaxID=158383 RepID=A0A8S0PAK5_OLEEU|nr:Hypothetical predicted protein [Olea europaea subsp. europaea]